LAKVAAPEVAVIGNSAIQAPVAELGGEVRIARMMIPMARELPRCLDEGIVEPAAEAYMALVDGSGFPPFCGGVLRCIDAIGAQTFCDMAAKFSALGALYHAPESLKAKAASHQKFYG